MRPPHDDVVIVGAGAAGCVLAARLSSAGARVTLVEAGPAREDPRVSELLDDASTLILEGANWPHDVDIRPPLGAGAPPPRRPTFRYPVGRVVGGSTAVNGSLAVPPLPQDFERWASLGSPSWGWAELAPWVERVRSSYPSSSAPRESLHPVDAAFLAVCAERGVPEGPLGAPDGRERSGLLLTSTDSGRRIDVGRSVLPQAGSSLTVLTDTRADAVRIERGRARGVLVTGADGQQRLHSADEVIVCAGALGTPALLQRSGIGDPEHLARVGVRTVADLPGVGRNLTDHVSLVVWATSALPLRESERWRTVAALLSSGVDREPDLFAGPLHDVPVDAIPRLRGRVAGASMLGMSAMLMRPRSRGRVAIRSADPAALPSVAFNLLQDDDDATRMAAATRMMWEWLHHPELAVHVLQISSWNERIVSDPASLRTAVRNLAAPGWHAAGTAAMGPEPQSGAVVDEECAVHGIEGLRVVDASIFPVIPSTPTAWATSAVAERMAARLLDGARGGAPAAQFEGAP